MARSVDSIYDRYLKAKDGATRAMDGLESGGQHHDAKCIGIALGVMTSAINKMLTQRRRIANLTAENERLIAALQAQILEKVALQDQLRKTQGIAA
jgi:hypothetical protein